MKIALVSDTHLRHGQHLPEELVRCLEGADLILHAGDVVCASVLDELGDIAPTVAVRGNCDPFSVPAPETIRVPIADAADVQLVHCIHDLGREHWEAKRPLAVVHGHTHRPEIVRKGTILIVNPGSPFTPRGGHAPSIAWLHWENGAFRAEIKNLVDPADI